MSNVVDSEIEFGTTLLPRDLTAAELAAAPILATIDSLLIEGLSSVEDEAFEAALAR